MVMLPQHEFTDVLKQWPVTPEDTHCHRHIHVSCIQLLRINTSSSLSQNQLLNSSLGLFHFWNVDIPAKPPEFVGSAALRAMQHSSSLPSLEGRCSRLVESALYVARGWVRFGVFEKWSTRRWKFSTGFDSAKLQKFEYNNNWLAIGLNDESWKAVTSNSKLLLPLGEYAQILKSTTNWKGFCDALQVRLLRKSRCCVDFVFIQKGEPSIYRYQSFQLLTARSPHFTRTCRMATGTQLIWDWGKLGSKVGAAT